MTASEHVRPDFQHAMLLLDAGDFGAARSVLQELLDTMSRAAAVRVLLARASEGQGRQDEALRWWREAARLCPSSPVVREGLRAAVLRREYGVNEEQDAEFGDLNRLIEELETARIVPDPDIPTVTDEEFEAGMQADGGREAEEVVSETLARIYANQEYFVDAAEVYEKLAVKHPERADEFRQKAADMRQKNTEKGKGAP